MKKLMIAVAMTIALPAAALAQATPVPTPAADAHAGHDMQGMDKQSCKDMQAKMAGMSGQMDHSKMDHKKMAGCADGKQAGAAQAPADPHANHQR